MSYLENFNSYLDTNAKTLEKLTHSNQNKIKYKSFASDVKFKKQKDNNMELALNKTKSSGNLNNINKMRGVKGVT